MYRFHSSIVERPHSIPRRCSSIFGIWREVLGCNVYITSQYLTPAIIYRDIIYALYPSSTPPPKTTAIFRDFKKSTAMCKVHNVGLRYIKSTSSGGTGLGSYNIYTAKQSDINKARWKKKRKKNGLKLRTHKFKLLGLSATNRDWWYSHSWSKNYVNARMPPECLGKVSPSDIISFTLSHLVSRASAFRH